jgi:hypothetical protein
MFREYTQMILQYRQEANMIRILAVEIVAVIVVVTAEEILQLIQEPVATVLIHVKLNGVHIINHVREMDIQNIILP